MWKLDGDDIEDIINTHRVVEEFNKKQHTQLDDDEPLADEPLIKPETIKIDKQIKEEEEEEEEEDKLAVSDEIEKYKKNILKLIKY